MTPWDDELEDDRFADLLASIEDGTSPLDQAFLDRLRDQTTDVFLTTVPSPSDSAPLPRRPRSTMFSMLFRLTGAMIAATVLVAVAWQLWPSENEPRDMSLAQVLDQAADSETLHLQVTRAERTEDVWVSRSNKLRWEESAERYLIVQGRRTYRIDESSNRVSAGTGDYFRPDRPGFDVFAMLGLARPTSQVLNETTPAEQVDRNGQTVKVYRLDTADRDGSPRVVEIEADGTTGKLLGVKAFALGQNGVLQTLLTLVVLADEQPVPDEKFVVKPTLSEDGRVGKIADVQGLVSRKPVLGTRWMPVRPNGLLMPGDWVRADARGANAATLRLLPKAEVIVGPGGLLEIIKPNQVRLHEGEAEVAPAKGTPIELLGPGSSKVVVTERGFYRIAKDQIAKIEKNPRWLAGYKSTTANESLGSLVAQVDGRNVSLSVGYHKVNVDIRDQIARTTIEETFVNHTDSQLEGVFHFPLPQDASISGFAMWIGDQMIEADVVEKQRAREIYEEIMRERRDPGLLEWTGGNIFKARVWPIFGNSEKRIRITYTQVLPLKSNAYRYSYALQSEMLQQHPLEELSLTVTVQSAAPLKAVSSPTHTVRLSKTENAAKVEFSAQQHTPTRDFEVVVELGDKAPTVAVVPHRRGNDGYFMVQLTTPSTERDQVASNSPLNLMLVCDTSASIDPAQRAAQTTLVNAMLEALTPKDTFNLAACDVNPDWAFEKPQPATAENVQKARIVLNGRVSLGWTDLDKTFTSALKQCGPKTQVIYLGDGIATTKDANPQAFAERLKTMYAASKSTATFHAVALGSTFEPGVLKAIGSLGSGSMRRVTGEQGPVAIALELLDEITRPPVRDLKVEFKGWKTAKVYPETLANLVPGTQQILIGRYLPEVKSQLGEVVVSGSHDGKPIRYAASATLPDMEAGNSFLPRLWARMHLDKLLEQAQTPTVKDDVIGLSEEFGIITPYTSFLVLESDADRERFKVKRRFQMREGELFFAKNKDDAGYELARQQMKQAGLWRVGLRRDILAELTSLGRDIRAFQGQEEYGDGFADRSPGTSSRLLSSGGGKEDYLLVGLDDAEKSTASNTSFQGGSENKSGDLDLPFEEFVTGKKQDKAIEQLSKALSEEEGKKEFKDDLYARDESLFAADGLINSREVDRLEHYSGRMADYRGTARQSGMARRKDADYKSKIRSNYSQTRWFDGLFPHFPEASKPISVKPGDWPKDARDLAKLLERKDELIKLAGGLRIEKQIDSFDPRDGATLSRSTRVEVYSPKSWVVRSTTVGGPTHVEWCDGKDRGIFGIAYRLGRVRAATPTDLSDAPMQFQSEMMASLDETFNSMKPTIEKVDGKTVLVLRQESQKFEVRLTIDLEKRVLVREEHLYNGVRNTLTTYGDFVQASGLWWPRTVELVEGNGRRSWKTNQTVVALTADEFAARVNETMAGWETVQLLKSPAPTVSDAKKNTAAGKPSFDNHFTLLNYYAGYQQWVKASEQLDALEKLAVDKPGVRWLRTVFLQASRRGEELREHLLVEADKLAKDPATGDRVTQADFIYSQGQPVLAPNEQMVLSDKLRPAYLDLPAFTYTLKRWKQNRVYVLQNRGDRAEELLGLQKDLATAYPRDYNLQYQYAQALYQRGERDAAYAYLAKVVVPAADWQTWEGEYLRTLPASWYENEGRYPELIAYLTAWLEQSPETEAPYSRYLSALIRSGEQAKAEVLIAKWIKEAQIDGEIKPVVRMRLQVAANVASGRGHNLNTDRIEPKWLPILVEAARFFANHSKHYNLTDAIFSWQFQTIEEGKKVKLEVLNRLAIEVGELATPRLTHLLALVIYNAPATDEAVWAKLATGLKARWVKTEDLVIKHQLGALLSQVYAGHINQDESTGFLRQQWKEGPIEHRSEYASQLFQALLAQPWTADRENEAVAMMPVLGDPANADTRLFGQVLALHHLTDRMVQARIVAQKKDLANPEKLTRPELAKKHSEFTTKARTGFAERVKATPWPEALRPWANAERIFLLARTDPAPLAAECWTFLGDAPKDRPKTAEPSQQQLLMEILTQRYLAMAINFATRSTATPALVERTLKYVSAGVAANPADPEWKSVQFQLLVALDRPKDLETVLAEWVKAEEVEGRWRTALGYVLAEQGKLQEAITLFESVEKTGELGYSGYQALAGWYMAVNQREPHEKALIASFRTIDEHTLSRLLSVRLQPWHRGSGHVPTELDKDVLRIFAAIFEKSSHPQNYLHLLQQYYMACRDFRLLGVMCDAVIGQSAGKVYPFLQGMQPVLNEVRDEAAADELMARIETLRKIAKTAVDFRALDLLEMQIRRRAAELLNQPGPHAEMALAAMKRAFARPIVEGEPLMMSNLLRDLGTIARADLATEQLRELRELHAPSKAGTFERMHLAHNHATVLGYYQRYQEGITLLRAALDEFAAAQNGILPPEANSALQTLVSFHEHVKQHVRAEVYLQELIAKPANAPQKLWLTLRLNELYHRTLISDNEVSLGKGEVLYHALEKRLILECGTSDSNQRYLLINLLCAVYRTAKSKSFDNVAVDVKAFANKVLPPLLKTQTTNYENVVGEVSRIVHDVANATEGIAFLLDRIADEPSWLRLNNQDGWTQFGYYLAQWREEAKTLPLKIEERLLTLVLTELRRDLRTQRQRNRNMYQAHYGHYWAAKEEDFARVADEIYVEKVNSSTAVVYIAEYFYHGCNRKDRAIGILLDAHGKKQLDSSGQMQLVRYLHEQNRHGQSIPILVPLIEQSPDILTYRTLLCNAYYHTGRKADLKAAFDAAEKHFRHKDRWLEGNMAALAQNAVNCQLYDRAVTIFDEVIPLHHRSTANRGVGNGVLSRYYQQLSVAHTGLGQPIKGIDAAGEAIVSWGANINGRSEALHSLNEVLKAAENLDAIMAHLDKELAETGLVNPIVRKALGKAYHDRGKFEPAIAQLQVALSAQPNDAETLQMLIDCFDKLKNPDGAIAQMVLALQLNRRDIKRYEALGQRLEGLDRPAEAERAYTSIVEVLPNESEGHALLAEIRQKQNRWTDAIGHWEQVAQIRALEPTGLLGLATAQLHEKQIDQAAATVGKLKARSWPPHFSDAPQRIAQLERQVKEAKK